MELFHGSSEEILEIHDDSVFGGIFAAADEVVSRSHDRVVHRVVSPRPLSNFELNYEIDGAWEAALEIASGDEAIAEAIMTPECESLSDCAPEEAADQGWEFQRLRGLLAAKLGYTSVEMLDEHGTTWLCLPGCEIQVVES